jgi:hypothetical protein
MMEAMSDVDQLPFVEIVAAPRYYLGLPLVVSVTWDNRSTTTTFPSMTPLDLTFSFGANVAVSMVPAGASGGRVETGFARRDEDDPTVALYPGERRQMVYDLSNLGVAFRPGAYDLTLTLRQPPALRNSNIARTELVALREVDALEAARVRQLGDAALDTGAWEPFLTDNLNTVTVSRAFDARAREQLGLHLFLHRAVWTPGKVANIDPAPLDAITGPHLDAEVAALRYEILHARHDPQVAAQRAALLARFPGMRHRVESIERGEGSLRMDRQAFGIESSFVRPPGHWPYQP